MDKPHSTISSILFILCFFSYHSTLLAQPTAAKPAPVAIDLKKARSLIERIDKEFSKDYLNGDSVAIAALYAKDAQFGSLTGNEILSYWGRSIRNSIKNNTRNLLFTTTALTTDGEFLVELGIYEIKDDKNTSKGKGKYVVVWKQEDGRWKLYRDFGL